MPVQSGNHELAPDSDDRPAVDVTAAAENPCDDVVKDPAPGEPDAVHDP